MTYFTKTALVAFLVATPLVGAHATSLSLPSPAEQDYRDSLATTVDPMSTNSITPDIVDHRSPATVDYRASIGELEHNPRISYDQMLNSEINSAATNLSTVLRNGYANVPGVVQIKADLATIRNEVAQMHTHGALTAASYQTLSAQLRGVNQNIDALVNG